MSQLKTKRVLDGLGVPQWMPTSQTCNPKFGWLQVEMLISFEQVHHCWTIDPLGSVTLNYYCWLQSILVDRTNKQYGYPGSRQHNRNLRNAALHGARGLWDSSHVVLHRFWPGGIAKSITRPENWRTGFQAQAGVQIRHLECKMLSHQCCCWCQQFFCFRLTTIRGTSQSLVFQGFP